MPTLPEHPDRKNLAEERPAGQEIELLAAGADTVKPERDAPTRQLHLCEACASKLVYPTDWTQDGERWRVSLRCPECEWTGQEVFDQDAVDAFDEQLEDGTQLVLQQLRELASANMSEYVERFAAALEAGAILPEDFAS